MAILSTPPNYGYEIMAAFGVDKALISQAKSFGVVIDQNTPGTFQIKYSGAVYGSVPIKGQALTLVKENKLGPASKQAIQHQFETYLKQAIQKAIASGATPALVQQTSFKDPIKSMFGSKTMKPTTLVGAEELGAIDDMLVKPKYLPKKEYGFATTPATSSLPKLINATEVYDLVAGTTSGSAYRVLAIYPGMSLACRIKGKGPFKLSLRAEGSLLSSYAPGLMSFGMEQASGYFSGHYDVDSQQVLLKALGAIAGQFGFDKAKALADPIKMVATYKEAA